MGIEDLDLDVEEHKDRILVVCDDQQELTSVTTLLARRDYLVQGTEDLTNASELAVNSLFDLVILQATSEVASPKDLAEQVQAQTALARIPLIILHPSPGAEADSPLPNRGPVVIQTPFTPSSLLVKVAMQLRLRKIRTEQSRFDAKIAQQNAELRDLTTRFKRELKEAQTIQHSILPKSLPTDARFEIAALYLPLEAVGGDLYDVFQVGSDHFGFFIGDVAGHGLPAAFIGAMTKMALAYANKSSPDKLLAEMNDGMSDHMPEGRFVTVAAAIYHAPSGLLQLARGGHPPPLLYRAETSTVELAEPRGLALGMVAGVKYDLFETNLGIGDKVLFYTDGLTEASNMSGEMLGVEGTARLFKQAINSTSVRDCLLQIVKTQESFTGGRILKDDITLIGIKRIAS